MNGREPFPTNKTGCAHLIRNWCRYPDPHNLQIAWPAHFNLFPSLQHESSTTDARTATSYGFGCDPVARQIELWHQGECPLSSPHPAPSRDTCGSELMFMVLDTMWHWWMASRGLHKLESHSQKSLFYWVGKFVLVSRRSVVVFWDFSHFKRSLDLALSFKVALSSLKR